MIHVRACLIRSLWTQLCSFLVDTTIHSLTSSSKDGTMTLICMASQNAELSTLQGLVQRLLCNLDGPTHAFSGTSVRNTRKKDVVFFWDSYFNSHTLSNLLLPPHRRGFSSEWRGLEKQLREADEQKCFGHIALASRSCLGSTKVTENERVFSHCFFSFMHITPLKKGSHVTRAGLQLSIVVKDDLELRILPSPPPSCWDCRGTSSCPP